eukprot:1175725-Prorocentrum_minimum.AAC.3
MNLNSCTDQDLVAAAGWTPTNELFSCSDDQTIYKWDMTGDAVGKVCDIESYFTDLHWYPVRNKQAAAGTDVFVVSCTDGTSSG